MANFHFFIKPLEIKILREDTFPKNGFFSKIFDSETEKASIHSYFIWNRI